MQDYRRLRVWTKTHAHVLNIRRATHRFPRSGYASLKSQAICAAESIAFNIVEGCGSASQKVLARFLDISIKSASELEYQIMLARDYGVLGESEWKSLSEETVDIRRMLCGLRAKVLEAGRAESVNHG